jgi:hypothetical protein
LAGLVEGAVREGDEVRKQLKALGNSSQKLLSTLLRNHIIIEGKSDALNLATSRDVRMAGVDGSLQPLEALGGIWYCPTSVVRVEYNDGLAGHPQLIVAAHIEKARQTEDFNVAKTFEQRMMYAETKAIMDWSNKTEVNGKSGLMIDGPVIDPPSESSAEYVEYRCDAIKRALDKGAFVLGCVKRIKDSFLLTDLIHGNDLPEADKGALNGFSSDFELLTVVFSNLMLNNRDVDFAFSKLVNIDESSPTAKAYARQGLSIASFFLQKDRVARPIRFDIPYISNTETSLEDLAKRAVQMVLAWSYPGIDVPIPVFVAHTKCSISEGCAEVLLDEIMAHGTSSNLLDGWVSRKLRPYE